MRFIECILAAILGSTSIAAAEPATAATRTLTGDAITQPSGGSEGLPGQTGGGSTDKHAGTGRKGRVHTAARRHHKGRHAKLATSHTGVGSSTGNAGGVKRSANQQPRPPRPRANPNANKTPK